MRLMMITPYSPWLNPWEQLIGAVKKQIKTRATQRKVGGFLV